MVNVAKLRGKIVECGISVSKLSETIGVDKATLYRRFSDNGESFTVGEIEKIAAALNLNNEELHSIFFVPSSIIL